MSTNERPDLDDPRAARSVRRSALPPAPRADQGDRPALGALIRDRRAALRLSLTVLAERVGVAKSYLSLIENGRRGVPSQDIIERLERALGLTSGELARIAGWERTPETVRLEFESLHKNSRAVTALTALVRRAGLDEAYRSGELGRVLDRMSEPIAEELRAALPHEVPVINSVTAGYPHDFGDLGYPARVADEYVRCPDLNDPDAFAARVVGDSMEPNYIEGDIVVFSPIRDAESGTDCFVRLEPDHESTFKRVYFETTDDGDEMIRIQPINNRYPPKIVPREEVAGLYRAVSLMRSVP